MAKHLIEQNFCDSGPVEFTLVDLDEKTEEAIENGEIEFEEAIDEQVMLHNMSNWSEIEMTEKNLDAFKGAVQILESVLGKKEIKTGFLFKLKTKRSSCIFRATRTG